MGLGAFLSSFFIWRRLRDLGLKEEKIIDFLFVLTFFGLISARLFYLVSHFDSFGFYPDHWLFLTRYPGLSFSGAMFGFGLAFWYFGKKQKWTLWLVADELVFGLLPFMILVKIGCFLDGSDLGRATNLPWGVYFPGQLLRRHPVSLIMGLVLLLIWLVLIWVERRWRLWRWYQNKNGGFISMLFLALFFLANFGLAFWRDSGLYWRWLEVSFSLLGFLAMAVFFKLKTKKR